MVDSGLDAKRVLRVRVQVGHDNEGPLYSFGSAYLVSRGRALTAVHPLHPPHVHRSAVVPDLACEVWFNGDADEEWSASSVLWVDPRKDLAVISVPPRPGVAATSFGRIQGTDPVPWTAAGYPLANLRESQRGLEFPFGRVVPETRGTYRRLGLTIESRTPDEREVSLWSGISGGPVFCQDTLVGVVTVDPGNWHGSLEAERVAACSDLAALIGALDVTASPTNFFVDITTERSTVVPSVNPLIGQLRGALLPLYKDELHRLGASVWDSRNPDDALYVPWHGWRDGAPIKGDLSTIVDEFRRTDTRHLVILGAAGSGKTAAAYQLAVRLLSDNRALETSGYVPFVVPLSTWNPRQQSPDDLVKRRLLAQFPWADPGPVDSIRELLSLGQIVPIFDGLDELVDNPRATEETRRSLALDVIQMLGSISEPWVLTSRPDAYWLSPKTYNANPGSQPGRPTILEIDSVPLSQAVGYLRGSHRGPSTWDSFFSQMMGMPSEPRQALMTAFTQPLMIGLARNAYAEGSGASPDELLTPAFVARQAVEEQLIGTTVDTAFGYRTNRNYNLDDDPFGDALTVRGRLTFLADHLETTGLPSIRWWLLECATPAALMPVIAALLVGPTAALLGRLMFGPTITWFALVFGAAAGASLIAAAGPGRRDRTIAEVTNNAEKEHAFARAMRHGTVTERLYAIYALCGIVTLVAFGVFYGLLTLGITGYRHSHLAFSTASIDTAAGWRVEVPYCAALAILIGLAASTAMYRVMSRASREDVVDIEPLSDADPVMLFGGKLQWTTMIGTFLLTTIVVAVGRIVAYHAVYPLVPITYILRSPMFAHFMADGLVAGVIIMEIVALLLRTVRFRVALLWLTATGRAPWRLKAFLDECASRRILRRTGSVYAFHHRLLQTVLAKGPRVRVPAQSGTRRTGSSSDVK